MRLKMLNKLKTIYEVYKDLGFFECFQYYFFNKKWIEKKRKLNKNKLINCRCKNIKINDL